MLDAAFALLAAWRARAPRRRLALWREASAQHFAGGAYSRGAELPAPGTACRCYPLSSRCLLTSHCLLLLTAHYSLLTTHHARLTTLHSLLTTLYSLLTTHC